MKFFLNHTPARSPVEISHQTPILLMGSCFAENIGEYLRALKFKSLINPDGIIFNPLSLAKSIDSCLKNEEVTESLILERDGLYCSYLHHSSVNASTKDSLILKISENRKNTYEFLKSAEFLILTFGSAFVFYHTGTKQPVANCHKQPSNLFGKKLLKPEDIISEYSKLIMQFRKFNPGLKVIFTVSPVKYLKDGIEENSLSKSTLLLSVHELVNTFENCYYFPAYELVNDDLRDYRFYKEDLAHPNEMAIKYVWEKFSQTYFSLKTLKVNEEISKLNLAMQHRPIHESSVPDSKHTAYVKATKETIFKLDPSLEL